MSAYSFLRNQPGDLYRSWAGTALVVFSSFCLLASSLGDGQRQGRSPSSWPFPEPVTEADVAPWKESSPFLRTLNLSNSLILTGTAEIEGEVYATLFDLETRQSHVVSQAANPEGWKMVELKGDQADIETLTAQIEVTGGQVISVRYQKLPPRSQRGGSGTGREPGSVRLTQPQLNEARHAAIHYREGYSSDGYPREPPPDMVRKLSRLNVQQREAINREMIELRNRGLGMEERRRIYNQKVDRSLQGGR